MTASGGRDGAPRLGSGFWRVLGSSGAANLGDGIEVSAFPLLALTLSRNPLMVACLTATELAPWVLFGPVAGAIVDRVDQRRLMLAVGVARGIVVSLLAVAVISGLDRLWLLYVVAILIGAGQALYDTAAMAIVPSIVSPANLTRANGLISTVWTTFQEFLGPLVGAKLFEFARSLPFLAHAASMYLSSLALAGRPPTGPASREPAAAAREPASAGWLWRQFFDGYRVLAGNRVLRAVALATAAVAAADSAWFTVLVIYVTETLKAPPATFGVLLAVSSLGGVSGGLLMERFGSRFTFASVLVVSAVALTGAQFGLALAGDVVVAGIMLLVSSMALATWNTVTMTIRQQYAAAETIGRITGTSRALVSAAAAVSALAGGAIAKFTSVRVTFLVGIPLIIVTTVWAMRMLRRPDQAEPDGAPASPG